MRAVIARAMFPNENNVVTTQGTAVVADPEALCICGLPGVYWRPRKGGGRAIWRCEEHRDALPDYAIEAPQRRRAGAVP